jgi:hypothetical protein
LSAIASNLSENTYKSQAPGGLLVLAGVERGADVGFNDHVDGELCVLQRNVHGPLAGKERYNAFAYIR